MKKTVTITALALVFAASAYAQQGHKETDRLIKRAEEMKKDLETATVQVGKTMDYYNAIMKGGAGDTRKLFKDLTKAIEDTGKRAANVTKRVEEMEAEAHLFFGEWTESLQAIQSTDLKKRSQDRLNETRVHFGEILSAGRRAGAVFNPFMGALKDQVVYMGYDLNASAVASLSEDAKKLNAEADKLFASVDEVPENRGRVRSFAEARVRFSLICRRGRALFVPEGDEWVHVRGPPSGNQHGRERDEAQEDGDSDEGRGLERSYVEKRSRENTSQKNSERKPERESEKHPRKALLQNERHQELADELRPARAERRAHRHFALPRDAVGEKKIRDIGADDEENERNKHEESQRQNAHITD